jgi:hypothetical protein
MALDVKSVEYFDVTVEGGVGEWAKLLSVFSEAGVNLLAFKAGSVGRDRTRFSLFPNDAAKMEAGAKKMGLKLDGPYHALLVKGYGDEPGELAGIYEKLSSAGVVVSESSGIADIKDSYGVVLYVEEGDCEKALAALVN